MSFRTRLSLFFVLIAVVPMIALGVVVLRLISDSETGKASARAGAYATAVLDAYRADASTAVRVGSALAADRQLAAAIQRADPAAASRRVRQLARTHRLARARIALGRRALVDVGDPEVVAGGATRVRGSAAAAVIEAATTTAATFARAHAAPGLDIAISRNGAPLAASLPGARAMHGLPPRGTVTLDGADYAVAAFRAPAFAARGTDTIAVLVKVAAASGAAAQSRWIALGLLAAFLLLAAVGALTVSRQLQHQIARFLAAAQRIGRGDFSARVPVHGDDEFAALGHQFNEMAGELAERVEQVARERGRLRELVHRIGETFASSLDRPALLEIGTQTAVDAVAAACGRATVRGASGELLECARVGDLAGAEDAIQRAEAQALAQGAAAMTTSAEDVSALAAPIAHDDRHDAIHGVITVARRDAPFDATEQELVASLGHQAGVLLENLDLHDQVKRQAVTDELTGLFNHRRFQEVVATEVAAAHRFGQPLGLLMLDVDDFKQVNDTYGHQQGDVVLREVARVLRAESREIDEPARYGGEEMAVALPQTDLDGAHAIAERVRIAVERLAIPRLDGAGTLHVTVSCGVASSAEEDTQALIAATDAALYAAKRAGKNRTERAAAPVRVEQRAPS
jgi:diguanylate cyclase (GGDEF)-like protein